MKKSTNYIIACIFLILCGCTNTDDYFKAPDKGFTSISWADNPKEFKNGLLTGNGTMGAIVLGRPFDENIYVSHAGIYLPRKKGDKLFEMTSKMEHIQKLCLQGKLKEAGMLVNTMRMEQNYMDWRDPYIGACILNIKQPEGEIKKYQRSVDFMTAETNVSVSNSKGTFQRTAFASREDDVVVVRLKGDGKQTAEISLSGLVPHNDREREMQKEGVKSSEKSIKDGLMYMRTLFAHTNKYNPNLGFEGFGKVISKGGERTETDSSVIIKDADEILVLIKVEPITKGQESLSNYETIKKQIEGVNTDYNTLLASHSKKHGELMGRVDFSLNAPEYDRQQPNEILKGLSKEAPLAMIERAFYAGRYNIICSTGLNPPNLVGLWSATWSANWEGSFTTNGNLPCAVAFNLMGNTPELMEPYFRYHDERWEGFRTNAKQLFGTRGFNIPGQLTMGPLQTDFSYWNPHVFWHAGAAWTLLYYYDYYRYYGDEEFLKNRTYPLMRQACEFYEDFLTRKDKNGKYIFVPTYSPENFANGKEATTINATMEIAAAKQLLNNSITVAKQLGVDESLQKKWASILKDLPEYEVDEDGYFREWLWPGLKNNLRHRHASQLYPLYDDAPEEIINNPTLVKGIEKFLAYHLPYKDRSGDMAFGVVQDGLAATRIGNSQYTQEAINLLSGDYWTYSMSSLHDQRKIMNMDISGGFPYLCSSALVYADPGYIRFFPALPEQWKEGSIKGIRLRGGILVKELTWNETSAQVILISDKTQTIDIEVNGKKITKELGAGVEEKLAL
ncbi:glycosyl hydrolase family 95 catalytic domain-containing protein [Marinifilum sp.]|uniref:glycosyl hydrolase family 95 catalytic domain-containing protein n=1 Tax=Marinifilum sp. TaxID=2033137 RepID=UPI003BABD086